ncbi:hypothetical protein [Promicromonospora sp. NFX87]|uniref:hypothetical protein n=1 Tax=Promicromonospora sp. NFX87 TaxID=3402691 RepID=UPI003AFA295E
MHLTIEHARLASRRERRSLDLPKAHRDRTWFADTDGSRRAVGVPGPAVLAAHVTVPGVKRSGRTLVLDGTPVPLEDVVAALKTALAALPDVDNAEAPYRDLLVAATFPGAAYSAYAADAAREWVKLVPRVPRPPRPAPEDRTPAMTATERSRLHRARRRREERESAEWVIRTHLEGDPYGDTPPPTVGDRIPGRDLFGLAESMLGEATYDRTDAVAEGTLEEWLEGRDDLYAPGCPAHPRMVSRQMLYAAAADMGLRITRPGNAVVLTVIRRLFRRLKEATVYALQHAAEVLGDHRSPEEFHAETLEAIGAPVPPSNPDPELEALAEALPGPVASAMASSDDPLRSLELVGAYWARRHPETRDAIVAAHRAFSPALVEHVRFLVASAIEADV